MIFDYWAECPPPHRMLPVLAQCWGWKPPRRPAPMPQAHELLALPGMLQRPVGEGLPAAVLDFAELKKRHARG